MKQKLTILILMMFILFNASSNVYAHSVELDFYQMFEEHGSIMLLIDSKTGKIEHANKAASEFYGYTIEEFESMKIHKINALKPEELEKRMLAASKEKGSFYILEQRLANGEIRTVEVNSCPHTYGDKTLLFATISDITNRIQLEKKNRLMNNVLFFMLSGTVVFVGLFSIFLKRNFNKLKKQKLEIENLNELRKTFINADKTSTYLKDENLKYIFVNNAFENLYKKDESEITGLGDFDIVDNEIAEIQKEADLNVLKNMTFVVDEMKWKNQIFQATKFPVKLASGNYGIGGYINDITEEYNNKKKLEKMNESLNKSNILISAILESSPAIIVFALDTNYCYLSFNKRHEETIKMIWGKDIEIGMNMLDIISRNDDIIKSKENFDKALSGKSFTLVEKYGDENLSRLVWQNYYSPIYSKDGKVIGLTCFVLNITDQKKAEEEVLYLSYHDELTGLYNRRFFEEELRRLDTERNLPISIIVGDMNGLKLANDIFGHASGDLLLQKAAEAFKNVCRADDIIARVGGDEFTILLPKTKAQEAKDIILRIKNQFSKESVHAIRGSISLGCDTKIYIDEDMIQTLQSAEKKMYSEKTIKRNSFKSNAIRTIIDTLHENSSKEKEHSKNVSMLCENVGKVMDLSEIEIRKLKDAGYLHDIGKIVLDEKLINKNEILTGDELKEMHRHPIVGYRILNSFDDTLDFAESILAHHERWDGSGYPKGLKGEEIPKLARIIAVAESYDKMTNKLNKNAISKNEAINELKKQAASKFDPIVVDLFVKMILK